MQLLPFKTLRQEVAPESLKDEINQAEQEARMVLPGIQALFGFQLVAAFNTNFKGLLSRGEQTLHLIALVLVALSVMLVLTPAAYHRQAERSQVSRFLSKVTTMFLTLSLVPMMLGIVLDVYVIAMLIRGNTALAWSVSLLLLLGFAGLWFVFPALVRREVERHRRVDEPPDA
jgi:hypothetical protein